MPNLKLAVTLAVTLFPAACGGGSDRDEEPEEPEEPPMRVEDTVVGDLVTSPGRVEDRTNAAMDVHREALKSRIEADEGASPGEDVPPED
ncbi:MAG: hypothetical protein ACT4UP_02060 [Gammaproteobacteria bacterium]